MHKKGKFAKDGTLSPINPIRNVKKVLSVSTLGAGMHHWDKKTFAKLSITIVKCKTKVSLLLADSQQSNVKMVLR